MDRQIERLTRMIGKGVGDPWRGAFLWVGAGLSIPAGYPSLGQLAGILRKESLEELSKNLEPMQVVDAFVEANGAGYLQQTLADIFTQKSPMEYHKDLVNLPWKGIITTNYDELLEDALKQVKKPYIKITLDRNVDLTARSDMPLYKVHGDIAEFSTTVLSGESYEKFNRRYPFLKSDLESHLRKHSIVFFGCGMTDPRLLVWLRGLGRGGRRALMPSCAVITEDDWGEIPDEDRKILTEGNIKPVLLKEHVDIPKLISHLIEEIPPESEELHLEISFASDERAQWRIKSEAGGERLVDVPWKGSNDFGISLMEFADMADKPASDDAKRAELHSHAVRLGDALGAALLTDEDRQWIRNAGQDGPPLVTIESDDDLILSLPWELLRMDGEFAVRDGRIDLVRSTASAAEHPINLSPPDRYMKLVVNISAPESDRDGGKLNCEAEGYRIIRALHDYSDIVFTDLGSADDMVDAIADNEPVGVHFSGHGMPGKLLFEDDEGMGDPVAIGDLLTRIRKKGCRFPRFFYLASCYGNTPTKIKENEAGTSIAAAQLHREGVVQVIGYYGPIVDELSTMAEVAIYRAMADGRSTRDGVRQARSDLAQGVESLEAGKHKIRAYKEMASVFPFAWAQLVFYHRGPDYPLSLKLPEKYAQEQEAKLERSFEGTDQRGILSAGFIGRRQELHRFRRAVKGNQHVFVFQGLGGLGKSTLAFRTLPMVAQGCHELTIWCQEMEDEDNQAQELIGKLSDFGQSLFGPQWVEVVSAVDRIPDVTERFGYFLQVILNNRGRVVIYLDNLESLLIGPEDEDPAAFGNWRSPEVAQIWEILKKASGDNLSVMASCRYRNRDFGSQMIHVPEMSSDAIFRMMGWFDGLRQLSVINRAKLVSRLHGHPRAVEFLADLIDKSMKDWEDKRGQWVTPAAAEGADDEWEKLIAPALPMVEERLRQNLLLDAIWRNVLDDECRRMLFRMTLLRRPWDWDMMMQLGESDHDDRTEETAQRLRETSLLTQLEEKDVEGKPVRLYQVHPMTAKFVAAQFDESAAAELGQATYQHVGTYLEKLLKTSPHINVGLDAGHYLIQCGEFDRAFEILGSASQTLLQWGQVRRSISVLKPFEQSEATMKMNPRLRGQMLGTIGLAYANLGQVDKAIEYHQQALVILKEIGDRMGEGTALGSLGSAYHRLGQVDKAIEYCQQALVIARETGDQRGEGNRLGNLGNAYADLGQAEKAIEYYQQALEIQKATGDRLGEGNALGSLGNAYHRLGQVEKAIEHYQQEMVIHKETGNQMGEGQCLGGLGSVYYQLGQVEKAIEHYQQALEIAREISDRASEGHHLQELGRVYAALGQVDNAREYMEAALAIAREIKDPRMEETNISNLEKL